MCNRVHKTFSVTISAMAAKYRSGVAMAVTIREVALRAKVSAATVSRVINRDSRISHGTATRVLAAIGELGYTVNHMARSLKTNRSFAVGLICPEFTNEFYMGVAKGIEQALKGSQLSLMICNSNEDAGEESQRIDLLLEKRVDGIIIIPASDDGAHFVRIRAAGVPIVLVDRIVRNFAADAVLVDNGNGAYGAVERAIGAGFRRIAFIGGDQRLTSARERWEGFRRAMADFQLPVEPLLERFGNFHTGSGHQIMGDLLTLPAPPDAVFISNYFMHVGATRYIAEHRADIANPPAIYSFDDMELSFALGYCRAIVRQPTQELGSRAAELLLERIRYGSSEPPRIIRLRTQLITIGEAGA